MKTSQAGISLIKKFEGIRLNAYRCSAHVLTIGYGHTAGVYEGQRITQDEAEDMLKSDLLAFERGIAKFIKVALNQNQFDSLVSFAFNLGLGTLQRSTLRQKLNRGEYEEATDEFLKWTRASGKVLPGLVRRRQAERLLFLITK